MKAKDLKNSILQMAVEGKLVPQDPADEPADALLERIREEKHKLIAEGKAKFPKDGESIIYIGSDGSPYEKRVDAKGRVLSDKCIADEVPFEELPEGWAWARLASIASFGGGKTPPTDDKSNYVLNGILWVTSKDMKRDHIDSTLITLSEKGAADLTLYDSGCIVMVTRSGILRRHLPVAILDRPATVNQDQKVIIPNDYRLSAWMLCFFQGNDYRIRSEFGKDGTTVESIVFDKVKGMPIPIPPLAEQRRIVERVNELLPLVEEYGELEDTREALDADLPGRLRKSVLQMAVRGKLVPQDPTDEPASALLGRIREQRAELVRQKKMKAPKGGESVIFTGSDGRRYEKRVDSKGHDASEPACIEDEIPFEIPESWEWARLQGLICLLSGTDLKPGQYNSCHNGIPYLTGASNFSDSDLLENRWTVEPSRISLKGDLLFTCKGTVGEMAINRFDKAHIARQIMAISPNDYEMLSYLTVFLKATVEEIKTDAKGVIPGIERGTLLSRLIPVPPLTEQSRIAEKVVGLFEVIQ